MHKKTDAIFKNLGLPEEAIADIEKAAKKAKKPFNRRLMSKLKKLQLPEDAIRQIKFLEEIVSTEEDEEIELSNKELIAILVKKLKRSFDAFANKGVHAVIVFSNETWTIFAEEYSKEVQHFHEVCKPHFDEWCQKNIDVKFEFNGSNVWKIIAPKKSDLPDI